MSKGLFIGRLQPLHCGHLKVMERILQENDELIIGLGNTIEPLYKNPFSLDERIRMVKETVRGNCTIVVLEDFNNNKLWMDNIEQKIKDFDIVYTGNSLVERLFSERGHKVKKAGSNINIRGTTIRDMIYMENNEWKKFVPKGTVNVIEKINGIERVKGLYNKYYANLARNIEDFIKECCKGAKSDGCVIGISGGVDSTVCAFLAVNALGKENVLGILAPPDDPDALKIAKKLGIKYEAINIEPIVESYKKETKIFNDKNSKGNLKSRIRMGILYGYANEQKRMVMGTGNKSELVLGYFTKYGDGACDMLPLGDFLKREIYGLAKYLSVPESIINKAPSAGLYEGQTDEGEIGMSYRDEIDPMLSGDKEISKKLEDIINKFNKDSHKLKPPKIFLKKDIVNKLR